MNETNATDQPVPNGKSSTRLSAVSKAYDRANKGYLDDKEQKMREMDTSNRGFLSNDKVYAMLEEQTRLQRKMVSQRWMIVGLCVFAVVLALANMGTAFAAARLSKDTRVVAPPSSGEAAGTSSSPILTDLDGNAVATKTVAGSHVTIPQGACVNVYDLASMFTDISTGSSAVLSMESTEFGETEVEDQTIKSVYPLNGATSSEEQVCFTSAASKEPICYDLSSSCGGAPASRRKLEAELSPKDAFHALVNGGMTGQEDKDAGNLRDRRRLGVPGWCSRFDCRSECGSNPDDCSTCCVSGNTYCSQKGGICCGERDRGTLYKWCDNYSNLACNLDTNLCQNHFGLPDQIMVNEWCQVGNDICASGDEPDTSNCPQESIYTLDQCYGLYDTCSSSSSTRPGQIYCSDGFCDGGCCKGVTEGNLGITYCY